MVHFPLGSKSSPTTFKSNNFIEMETYAGRGSEPVIEVDPKIFDDPEEHHIRDNIWTKSQPNRWGEHIHIA